MLNPETLIARRVAGLSKRNGASGPLQGVRQTDDALLYTGGGTTEMILDLLFDTTLAGITDEPGDVRALTRPLWNLAENSSDDQGQGQVPIIRFVWGKAWNIPGVITAVAERLEFFSETGIPRRSWLRMRFCRVDMPDQPSQPVPSAPDLEKLLPPEPSEGTPSQAAVEVTGGPQSDDEPGKTPSRLDEIAYRNYGSASLWRTVACFNKISDPLHVAAGTLLRLPDLSSLKNMATAVKEKL